jgi:hypothetical protein
LPTPPSRPFLQDDSDLSVCLRDGLRLLLLRKPADPPPPPQASSPAPKASTASSPLNLPPPLEDPREWRDVCSRVFSRGAIFQPAHVIANRKCAALSPHPHPKALSRLRRLMPSLPRCRTPPLPLQIDPPSLFQVEVAPCLFVCGCDPSSCLFASRHATFESPPPSVAADVAAACAIASARVQRRLAPTPTSGQIIATVRAHVASLDPVDPSLTSYILSLLPPNLKPLKGAAGSGNVDDGVAADVALVKDALKWFKSAFKWVDSPPCKCGGPTRPIGGAPPTREELSFRAGVVELHRCDLCGETVRFARYNDARKVMEERRGRCGEWARGWGAVLAALGLDVRAVYDSSDHVWCEAFVNGRWRHTDACEEAFDSPLLYERGWGKKHSFVFAVARAVDFFSSFCCLRVMCDFN